MEKRTAVKIITLAGNTELGEKTINIVVDGNKMQSKLNSSIWMRKNLREFIVVKYKVISVFVNRKALFLQQSQTTKC